jgi:uncharacterized protein YqeY
MPEIDQKLIDYIASQRSSGFSEPSIRSSLIIGGWDVTQIDVALAHNSVLFTENISRTKKRTILLVVAITVLALIGTAIALFYQRESTAVIDATFIEEFNEDLFDKFCTSDPTITPKTSGIDINEVTFEELAQLIQQAKASNDFERLQLIRLVLARMVTEPNAELAQSTLYSEALNLDWRYTTSPDWYRSERSYATKSQRFEKVKELSLLFNAMHKAGFTKNFSKGKVTLAGKDRTISQEELNYYHFYFSTFYQKLLTAQQGSQAGYSTVQSSATVFLAEISIINEFLPTKEVTDKRIEDWLSNVQEIVASSSKESIAQKLLKDDSFGRADTGLLLGLSGYLDARSGNIDIGMKLLNCAALQYNDQLAMANLGEINSWERNRQSLQKALNSATDVKKRELEKTASPIFLSETPLPNDIKKSLYWSLLAEKVDVIRGGALSYADNGLGWNNIGRIDTIVNTGLISDTERSEVNCEVLGTLQLIYPEISSMYEPSGCGN